MEISLIREKLEKIIDDCRWSYPLDLEELKVDVGILAEIIRSLIAKKKKFNLFNLLDSGE